MKANPLLVILSPRDIPHFEENFHKINYVDKLWIKYYPILEAHKQAEIYFMEHPEYTHIMLVSDDGIPKPDSVSLLIADLEKYDLPVISGVSTVDSLSDDMFLGVTQNEVCTELKGVNRKNYECLPNEFIELQGLIKIWFEGNAMLTIRRDVLEKVHLTHPKATNPRYIISWAEAGDLANSLYIAKAGYEIHADLRVFMQHFRWSHSTPPFNCLVGAKIPELRLEKATAEVPHAEPADIITEIPQKFKDLMDFYYGEQKVLKVCIVAEFPQQNYFQWYTALNKLSNSEQRFGGWFEISNKRGHRIVVSAVELSPTMMAAYPDKTDKFYDPIREADIVFVYVARQDMNWDWWSLPIITKKFMNDNAKMICQFDDELWWTYKPEHSWWDAKYDVDMKGKTPEQFFNETGLLEIADIYFSVFHDVWWAKYSSKPVVYMPLPQIERYSGDIIVPNVATTRGSHILQDRSLYTKPEVSEKLFRPIATLHHTIRTSSAKNTINKILKDIDSPVYYFTSRKEKSKAESIELQDLPKRSKVFTDMKRNAYMFMLRECYVAIDDNDGYVGWSRFAYECALSCVPCVGSTESIKQLFPDLYTEPKDYVKQKELLDKLLNDKNFYDLQKYIGFIKATQELSDANLVTKFLKTCMWDLKYHDYGEEPKMKPKKINKSKPEEIKIYACYVLYNEEDKIAISLNSIVPYVDKVIVVDGAWSYFENKSPESTDKTKEICESICGDKLIWVDCPKKDDKYVPWESQVTKRDAYLQIVPTGSWFYIIDADVLVTGKLKEVFDGLKANDSYKGNPIAAVRMMNFYPVLSENSRAVPPKFIHKVWEIEEIEKSGLTDWFKEDPDPRIISPINWVGYYGPVICLYKKMAGMHYRKFHSKIFLDDKHLAIEEYKYETIPDIVAYNMKFTNSWQRHVEMAKHKHFEAETQRNRYLTHKREVMNKAKEEKTIEANAKKILIATPFCNEAHSIDQFMVSLKEIAYPKSQIDLLWIENNSSDDTWEMLNKYYEEFKSLGYSSHRLQQKTSTKYGKIIKQVGDEYGKTGLGGKIGQDNPHEVMKQRPAHQISIWNDMLNAMTDEHEYILFWFADTVCPTNLINKYKVDFNEHPDAGWLGGVMHKRSPRHKRVEGQHTMHYGLASPYVKVYERQPDERFVVRSSSYPYGVRAMTEDEILHLRKENITIVEACCTGHVFMISRKVVKEGFKFELAPLETGLQCERFLNSLGLKMYADLTIYIQHISVDGKIYVRTLDQLSAEEELAVKAIKEPEILAVQPIKEIIKEVQPVEPILEPPTELEREEAKLVTYLVHLFRQEHDIPNRPMEGSSMYDDTSKSIITCAEWDIKYGRWKDIYANEELYEELRRKAKKLV